MTSIAFCAGVVPLTPLSEAQPTAADIATFSRGFGDARLNALIERGLAVNGDVKLAMARLDNGRDTQLDLARSQGLGALYPRLSLSGLRGLLGLNAASTGSLGGGWGSAS